MLYIIVLLFFFFTWFFVRTNYIVLELQVKVPDYTPDNLFIIGNHESLGQWTQQSHQLKKINQTTFTTNIRVPKNTSLEFKFTLGSWETVQKDQFFNDTNNFIIIAKASELIELQVSNFAGFERESQTHTRVGHFDFLRKFESKLLKNHRNIIIYLPPSYKKNSRKTYPVLYMNDGNNLFDANTAFMGREWEVDNTCQELIEKKLIEEIIIVGIYNTMGRLEEYTPTTSKQHGGGKAKLYLDFITKELMPEIEKKFRVKTGPKNTGLMGSSLGGLISLYAGFEYDSFFGNVGVISPSLWWDDKYMFEKYIPNKTKNKTKIWMDMGTKEGMDSKGFSHALLDTQNMNKLLIKKGFNKKNLFYFEHENAAHDEFAWATRMHMPLLFFYGITDLKIELNKTF
ncbi:MAG: esterase [Candidatus Cloacimonadota bacterium]|nr:MAG: esterase [Candidatus Cloacimonadota bacterium]